VSVCVALSSAPGTASPDASCTVPLIWDVEIACAHILVAANRDTNNQEQIVFIEIPQKATTTRIDAIPAFGRCQIGLLRRRRHRPIAVEGRPVRRYRLLLGIKHRCINRADLALLDKKPLTQQIAAHRNSGLALEESEAEHHARLFVDN